MLQALSELKLLHLFDYVSTVSGGGYIGSWLSAFITRRANGDRTASRRALPVAIRPLGDPANHGDPLPAQLQQLPHAAPGRLSADTLAAMATYLRNLYLNLTILTLFLVALLMVPRIVGSPAATSSKVDLSLERHAHSFLW